MVNITLRERSTMAAFRQAIINGIQSPNERIIIADVIMRLGIEVIIAEIERSIHSHIIADDRLKNWSADGLISLALNRRIDLFSR